MAALPANPKTSARQQAISNLFFRGNLLMNPHPRRVLCVEDEEDTCSMITVCLVSSTAKWCQLRHSMKPGRKSGKNVLISIYWITGCLEAQVLTFAGRFERGDAATPIIFYSGAAYESDRQEAREAGAQAYLIKPTDIAMLMESVRAFLK